MPTQAFDKARHVSDCLELAVLLEASAHKPGNVNIVTDFDSTRYEHFLASAVAAAPSFEQAAERGIAVSAGEMRPADAAMGRIIRDCVSRVNSWQHGGNTLLGTIILLVPIAAAAGATEFSDQSLEIPRLRERLKLMIESTTPEDAVDVYEAIGIAGPAGLGAVPEFDVNDPDSASRLLGEGVSLFSVFKLAAGYDTVCSEWVSNYPVTFDLAYPSLSKRLAKGEESDRAIVSSFLEILSRVPDTFIARKAGMAKARKVSAGAAEILKLGGFETAEGRKSLGVFDRRLREEGNLLNPGTTADVMAAALSLCVLGGYRP